MFLGIDLGTSGVKAVIVDAARGVLGQATARLSVSRPHPGWSEQAPGAWWRAATDAVQTLDPALRAAVRGVGLAGQMHGAVLLGADDRPLRPAILWDDGRSQAECAALEVAAPRLRGISGNCAMPGFTAPKLLWVRHHEPAIFAATRRVLLPKDYLRLLLTGEAISDMSDSAGTLWLDVAARDWSDTLLAATGLTRRAMPALVEGTQQAGRLLPGVAAAWGVPSVPVAGGGGDNAAGAAGIGVVRDGDALLSLGSSGVIFVANARFSPNPSGGVHAFCHCLPGMWHQMSVHLSAARAASIGRRVSPAYRMPQRCWHAPRQWGRGRGEKYSCRIWQVSGPRITMLACAALFCVSTTRPMAHGSHRLCWKGSRLRCRTAWPPCARPAPGCRA